MLSQLLGIYFRAGPDLIVIFPLGPHSTIALHLKVFNKTILSLINPCDL